MVLALAVHRKGGPFHLSSSAFFCSDLCASRDSGLHACHHRLVTVSILFSIIVILLTFCSRMDGLNKPMSEWNVTFYGRRFNSWCKNVDMTTINYPDGE